ncbi:hypothetical protein H6P81_002167 [Aristolochia fimbriata]|uniref:CASP-like protein n=1 Tax=Aristolochia fimbriata TaxID=158543 RepID=A0AAV7FAS7_ARIFI|nr:hypothetical protein H6P81_002167 [Aristolochia fimbriata]
MASARTLSIVTLVLRIVTLLLLAGSVVILATDKITSEGSTFRFKDVIAFRYVMATALLGFLYTLFQIPFAIYHVCTEKRLIQNESFPQFDFYADKIVACLVASGVGAGFAVSFELKRLLRDFVGSLAFGDLQEQIDRFFDKANIAAGLLFLGFLCLLVQSVISSLSVSEVRKTTTTTSRGIFG